MFFDINKGLCSSYTGLDPLRLLDYPSEDVFDLIYGMLDYNERERVRERNKNRRKAGDDWF